MKEQLKQIFDENADCYSTQAMQSVMTSDKFIEVVSELMKPTDTWIEIKSEDDLPKVTEENKSVEYWIFNDNGSISHLPLSWVYTFKQMEKQGKANSIITHYQPIHKPQPPNQ